VDASSEDFEGIKVQGGAKVVIAPSFATTVAEVHDRVKGIGVSISDRSTLVLEGDVRLEGLDLDGSLVVRAAPGAAVTVMGLKVRTGAANFQAISESESEEKYAIRGYRLVKPADAMEIVVTAPGTYILGPDGLVDAAADDKIEAPSTPNPSQYPAGDPGPSWVRPATPPSPTPVPSLSQPVVVLLAAAMWSLVTYVL
jgi:hypothetical protein